jgi:uncharacterized Zn finger protein
LGRPKMLRKPEMTTIAITRDLSQFISLRKWKGQTHSDFLQQTFRERAQFKKEKQELQEELESAKWLIEDSTAALGRCGKILEELRSIVKVETDDELPTKLRKLLPPMEQTIYAAN